MLRMGRHNVIPAGIMGVQSFAPRSAAAAANWWEVSGKTCVAAYQPKGAASYAASLSNLANPGTYDAAEGVAPDWAAGTGWTFNGSTQYLKTGVVPAPGYTVLIQIANITTTGGCIVGSSNTTMYYVGRLNPKHYRSVLFETAKNTETRAGDHTTGNLCLAGLQPYRDGSADGDPLASSSWTTTQGWYIGGANLNGSLNSPCAGNVIAFAHYLETLTSGEVAVVAAAMAAL